MKKGTRAEIEKRVKEVLDLILAGAEIYDILQFAAENEWNVKERQLRTYVSRAYDAIAAAAEKDRDRLLHRHLAQRRNLYARALNMGDLRTALAIAKDEATLLNLYPAEKREYLVDSGDKKSPFVTEVRELVVTTREEVKMVQEWMETGRLNSVNGSSHAGPLPRPGAGDRDLTDG
jgi:hypothetical protein